MTRVVRTARESCADCINLWNRDRSFGGNTKIAARQFQEVGIGHDAVFNLRLFAGCEQIVPNGYSARPERGQCVAYAQPKRTRVQFMKLDSHLLKWLANIRCIELEVIQRLIGARVAIQLCLRDRFEESHNGWAMHNDKGLLIRRRGWR